MQPSKHRRAMAGFLTLALTMGSMVAVSRLIDRPVGRIAGSTRAAAVVVRDVSREVVAYATWVALRARFERAYRRVYVVELPYRPSRRGTTSIPDEPDLLREQIAAACKVATDVDLFVLSSRCDSTPCAVNALAKDDKDRIRFVYTAQHGCDSDACEWSSIGATTFVAHPYDEKIGARDHALFYTVFLRRLLGGMALDAALDAGNAYAEQRYDWGDGIASPAVVLHGPTHWSLARWRQS
ncbi:MAG: hypothetical protein H6833_06890 [Planctomycetes bacterium]|nr:hypothetical protein [Planctomycetota bacterium]